MGNGLNESGENFIGTRVGLGQIQLDKWGSGGIVGAEL